MSFQALHGTGYAAGKLEIWTDGASVRSVNSVDKKISAGGSSKRGLHERVNDLNYRRRQKSSSEKALLGCDQQRKQVLEFGRTSGERQPH